MYSPLGSIFRPYLTGQKVTAGFKTSSGSPVAIQFQFPEQTDQSALKINFFKTYYKIFFFYFLLTSIRYLKNVRIPRSQDINKTPRVKNRATLFLHT